jgi:DNA-binding NtrC family response regulator
MPLNVLDETMLAETSADPFPAFDASAIPFPDIFPPGIEAEHAEIPTQPIMPDGADAAVIAESTLMRRVKLSAASLATRKSSILVLGPTGSGKEILARFIHACSDRVDGPFVPVDCTSLTESLFESELFGHAKGAFTGAVRDSIGAIRSADGGTLFLDEIGELGLNLQAKLLRVIQERCVRPVGETTTHPVDIRLIAATHRNLEEMVIAGSFRQDLYFRLNVVQLKVPALGQRREDIVPLANHFLHRLAALYHEPMKRFTPAAIEHLKNHTWPGNVRELANVVEHAMVTTPATTLDVVDLPEPLCSTGPTWLPPADFAIVPLEAAQKHLVSLALKAAGGHQAKAARMLEIERRRLYRLVQRYGLKDLTRHGT